MSACSQHQYLLPWLNFSCVYHLTCRKKEQKKEKMNRSSHKHIIGITGTSQLFLFNSKYPHLSGNLAQKKNTLHSIAFFFFFFFNSKYHFIFLCVKIMEKWSQDVVDIMHWNCLAWQSTSSGHPFFHPKPRNCPHQINPFPARNNPSNACLCVLPPALLSANRVSPLNETMFQSTHYQMKWRLAHCT